MVVIFREYVSDFRGDLWDHGGPKLVTRIIQRVCQTDILTEMTPEKCWGFKALPIDEFYAIPYDKWEMIFQPEFRDEAMEMVDNSAGVHVWNTFSSATVVQKSLPETAYGALAAQNCPKVFEAAGEFL